MEIAHTNIGFYPGFVNVKTSADGSKVTVSVRSDPTGDPINPVCGSTASVVIDMAAWDSIVYRWLNPTD